LVAGSAELTRLLQQCPLDSKWKISVPQTEEAPECKEFWKFKNLSQQKVTKEHSRTRESLCTGQGRPL
jgi:hypothetical protein